MLQLASHSIRIWLTVLLWIVFGVANFGILLDFARHGFDDGTYSHAYLVPFISAYLLWDASRQDKLTPHFSVGYLAFAATLSALMCLAYLAQLNLVFRILFPSALIAYTAALFRPTFPALMPPAMLYFVAPIWGALSIPLQKLSTNAVGTIMALSPVPTYVNGNFIQIPLGGFEIAGGCSGLRYFIVSVAIGAIYCYLNLRTFRSYVALMLTAVIGAIVVNWLRIVGIILIGHYTSMQSPLIENHNMFGWYLYIPFLFGLFALGHVLQNREQPIERSNFSKQHTSGPIRSNLRISNVAISFTVLVVISTSTLDYLTDYPGSISTLQQTHAIPAKYGPNITDPSFIESETIAIGQEEVLQQRFFFEGSSDSNKATYYLNTFLPESLSLVEERSHAARNILLTTAVDGSLGVVAYSFKTGTKSTSSRRKHRLFRLLQALKLDRSSAVTWLYAPCDSYQDCDGLMKDLHSESSDLTF